MVIFGAKIYEMKYSVVMTTKYHSSFINNNKMDATTSGSLAKSLLVDHSSRLEQHRANFDTLQCEYLKLQEMYDKVKDEQCQTAQDYSIMVAKSEDIIRQLQAERDDKILECEQLQKQVMNPTKMAKLQQSVNNEMEDTYRKHIEELEMELEVKNNEMGQLKRAYDYLKLEYSALQSSSEARAAETKKEHRSQVSVLKNDIKTLNSKLERDIPTEIQRVRQLQRQNTELNETIKQLLNENKQLKSQMEDKETHKLQEMVSLKQEAVKTEGIIEQLSSDKISLSGQLKRLEKEGEESRNEIQTLSGQLHTLQRELLQSQRKCDELVHQHERVKDELLMNNLKEVQLIQEERTKCIKLMEEYKNQSLTLERTVRQLESALGIKNRELVQVKEDLTRRELESAVLAEKERGELEQQLAKSQHIFLTKTQEYEQQLSSLQDQLTTIEADKVSLESECDLMKKVMEEKKETLLKNGKELAEFKKSKSILQTLREEKESLESANESLSEQVNMMSNQIEVIQNQLNLCQSEIKSTVDNHQKELQKVISEYSEARLKWEREEKDLTTKCKDTEQQLKATKKKKDKLKRQADTTLAELHSLMETSTKREQESITERESLRKTYEEEKRALRKQLQSLHRQHQQFQQVIHYTAPQVQATAQPVVVGERGEQSTNLFTDSTSELYY